MISKVQDFVNREIQLLRTATLASLSWCKYKGAKVHTIVYWHHTLQYIEINDNKQDRTQRWTKGAQGASIQNDNEKERYRDKYFYIFIL